MLSFFEEVVDYDTIFFMPADENSVQIHANKYKDPGDPVGDSPMGFAWHIILFKDDEEGDGIKNLEQFDAILVDPREYISGLIPQDWYGVVAKKTTTSHTFLKDALDKLKKMC